MKFTPMTKEQIELANLLEPGIYPFQVLAASDEISMAGNEMIKLKLNVFGPDREAHVYDYLMEKLAYKLRHFAEHCGLIDAYEAGSLDSLLCISRSGYCKIGIDHGNGDFGPKNVVKDYVAPPSKPVAPPSGRVITPETRKLTPQEFSAKHGIDQRQKFDDDIPF